MRLRSLGMVALAAGALVQSCQPACTPPPPPPPPATTAPPPPPPPPPPAHPTSLTIAGQGNGHGRGLSAWGAYGMAVNQGASWQQIVDKYYGGTRPMRVSDRTVRVRLSWMDARPDLTVVSASRTARWNGESTLYGSLQAYQVAPNRYDVYGAPGVGCQGSNVGWRLVAQNVPGPITFTTTANEWSAAPGDVLGACRPDGSVTHYRGALQAVTDGTTNRTVNELMIENYLKGVLSREVSTSWGNAGGGLGMSSLRAMAVAARSFAHSQGRYAYAHTCDTSSCQVYGGAAFRRTATSPTSFPTATQVCESGNTTFECGNTNRAIADTAGELRIWPDGRIMSGEYSATHGPYSSGVNYPSVDDSVSNVPQNPLYTWTRTIPAADIAAKYGLGTLTGARTERDPGSTARGVWGNRIVLGGTAKTVTLTNLQFRNDFGLPSHGYAISALNR